MSSLVFIIVTLFFLVSIYWTLYLKWPQITKIKTLKNIKKDDLHAFFLTLATNLGVGNIIGVSAAIIIGGPGVIFWMFLFSFFVSALSYVETFYAVKSQTKIGNEIVGGTCYTIDKFVKSKYKVVLGIAFSFFLVLTNSIFFTPVQLNCIFNIFEGNYRLVYILISVCVILFIVFKGVKSIIQLTDKIVPIMTIVFLFVIIYGIIKKIDEVPMLIKLIITDAFNLKSCIAGSFVTLINTAITKSLFSNEAGLGTMPSLTGVSNQSDIEKTSYLQLASIIVDTCILCTLTGIFILLYYGNDMTLTTLTFVDCISNALGKIGLVIGKILVYIFGFSSAIGLYYLGESNILYFSYKIKLNYKVCKFIFQILYIIGMFIALFGDFQNLMLLVDIGLVILGTINIFVLFIIEKRYKFLKNNNIKILEEKE